MDYNLVTTAATFDTDLAATGWPPEVIAAVTAAKAISDPAAATHVEVAVATGGAGGWAVVRIAPFNKVG
jgi:hypothetical protein